MKLFIKNMVSIRCKMIVKSEIESLGLHPVVVGLGEVELEDELSVKNYYLLKSALLGYGLELMEDRKAILVEKIKTVVIELIHGSDPPLRTNLSVFLSQKLHYEYNYLSNLFSEISGTTIEQFVISNKIEKVKELLIYEGLTLKEISWKLHYSSVAHLSYQFKKVTGLTPTCFKKMHHNKKFYILENV
jgi:hypothetical protein